MIVLNSLVNLYSFKRAGKWPLLFYSLPLFFAGAIGNLISSRLALSIAKNDLKLIFAGILSLIVVRIITFKDKPVDEDNWQTEKNARSWLTYAAIGLLGGFVSGITGLGGGAVLIPAFMVFLNMPTRWLSPYSQMAMLSGIWGVLIYAYEPIDASILNTIPYSNFIIGHVHFGLVIPAFLGALTSSKLGVRINNQVSKRVKNNILCGFFIIVILRILITQLL